MLMLETWVSNLVIEIVLLKWCYRGQYWSVKNNIWSKLDLSWSCLTLDSLYYFVKIFWPVVIICSQSKLFFEIDLFPLLSYSADPLGLWAVWLWYSYTCSTPVLRSFHCQRNILTCTKIFAAHLMCWSSYMKRLL